MNYITPEQIKEYVSKNPEGIAGMSEELSKMVNHFVTAAIAECMEVFSKDLPEPGDGKMPEVIDRVCNVAEHFGLEK